MQSKGRLEEKPIKETIETLTKNNNRLETKSVRIKDHSPKRFPEKKNDLGI